MVHTRKSHNVPFPELAVLLNGLDHIKVRLFVSRAGIESKPVCITHYENQQENWVTFAGNTILRYDIPCCDIECPAKWDLNHKTYYYYYVAELRIVGDKLTLNVIKRIEGKDDDVIDPDTQTFLIVKD